jgi:hypothetical protein
MITFTAQIKYVVRKAQSPHRMTHFLHGGDNHGNHNGFTALGKAIGTPDSTDKDSPYVTEHPVLKYFQAILANFLNDFRRADWFDQFGLPASNGRHNQLSASQWSTVQVPRAVEAVASGLRFRSSAALTLGTRTSSVSSLSTAGRSGPTTSRCGCAWFAIRMQAKYMHLVCICSV